MSTNLKSIKVKKETWNKLADLGKKTDSFDSIINRLISKTVNYNAKLKGFMLYLREDFAKLTDEQKRMFFSGRYRVLEAAGG